MFFVFKEKGEDDLFLSDFCIIYFKLKTGKCMPQCQKCGEIVGVMDIEDGTCLKCLGKPLSSYGIKEKSNKKSNPFLLKEQSENEKTFKYAELWIDTTEKVWTVEYGNELFDYSKHFNNIMDEIGDMGWELVSVTPLSVSHSPWLTDQVFVKTGGFLYTFKKSIKKNQALAK